MSDPYPATDAPARNAKSSKSLLDRVLGLVRREPEDREGIKAVLDAAHERQLIDAESYSMIKGALAVSELTVADIMVPRARMDLLDISQPLPQLLAIVIETAHSRFPVYEDDRDNIIGILLAKDLLRCMLEPGIELRALVRPAVFIPEAKRLNVLLRDFRASRNHQAIVIDEHGGISGLVTMEDVLEEIVGDIEDEYDEDDTASIIPEAENQWRLLAATEISHFNDTFQTDLPDDDYDSVGGWMGGELGRIPKRGDIAVRGDLRIEVIRADARRALWLRVRRLPQRPAAESATPAEA
ncbi:magnesium and cobalt efflux protein [Bordetella ansorpii]|uniref:Magnesium and cobalt efflux protein CorC n=1 Tax=Bordetella ansorpii TaxID=288768 RepID=A0A157S5M9_9BORD|nr:transporter associated domain-containing protein [Bordetella ansorpii]SAI65720.1 magnesium and cobalt efflux protein [Bordetella ansorpii]